MDDDVLELTQMVGDDDPAESMSSEPSWDFPEPEPEPPPPPAPKRTLDFDDDPPPRPKPAPRRMVDDEDDRLISDQPAKMATAAFSELASSLGHERVPGIYGSMPLHGPGRTLEEVIKELLRPLLREWLDENLPLIVQKLVKAEIEKMVRRSRE